MKQGVLRTAVLAITFVMYLTLLATSLQAQSGPEWIGAFFVKDKVGLKWQPIEGAAKYNILRSETGGAFKVVASEDKTHYFDAAITPGIVYGYKVVAVMSDGTERTSTEKSVTIPGQVGGAFVPPVWVGLRVDRDKIFANWDNAAGAMAYNIHRSATPGGPYEIVGNVTTSKFADNKGLEVGKTYYYVLTALNDQFEETEKSEERSVKFGISASERTAADTLKQNIKLEEIKLSFLFELTDAGALGAMNQPADVAVNSKGDIYVNDVLNYRVNVYGNNGGYKYSFGKQTPPADKSNPPEGSFSLPLSMALDKQDRVYIGDVDQNDIQIFTPDGKFVKRITVAVKEDMKPFRPNGLFVTGSGQILATDAANHRFLVLDPDGKVVRTVGSGGEGPGNFLFIDGILMTPDSTICVVDVMNCRIQEFDIQGKFIRSFGEAGQTVGTFARPKALAVDGQKRIWVSDGMGNSVQVFTLDGQVKAAFTDPVKDKPMAGPRGMFIGNGRFYLVNRLLNSVWVFKMD